MLNHFCSLVLCLVPVPGDLQTQFLQVHPEPKAATSFTRSTGQTRAVILIHGFRYTLNKEHVPLAHLQDWQEPGSLIVQTIGKEADVFAFAYGQNTALEKVAESVALERSVQKVRDLGYRDIVLVGYSAGGLIARQFVEDHPQSGITRLIQVCSPNGGTMWATFPIGPSNLKLFMGSLSKEGRQTTLQSRKDKALPAHVQCACVVGCGLGTSDGTVTCHDQWTEDLQRLGVPAVRLPVLHFQAMHERKGANCLLELIQRDLPRLSEREVEEARKQLFKKEPRP